MLTKTLIPSLNLKPSLAGTKLVLFVTLSLTPTHVQKEEDVAKCRINSVQVKEVKMLAVLTECDYVDGMHTCM